jgi:hypothetical protein
MTMNLQPVLFASVLAIAAAMPNVQAGNAFGGNTNVITSCTVCAELSAEEAATLTFMREEEKLARDVYDLMYEKWNAPLFAMIAAAEQRHMDSVKARLDAYGLPDPAADDVPAWFADPELQALYDSLSGQGAVSYEDALWVGALIEEVDIEDNQNALDATDNPDLQTLYANLLKGSRNHLRAFVAELERLGVDYSAQYLEGQIVDAILESPMERGGTNARGPQGKGRK